MAEDTNTPAAASAPANTTIQRTASNTPVQPAGTPPAPPLSTLNEAPSSRGIGRAGVITNPTPPRDLDAVVPIEDNTPSELPASTIAEMEAGAKALERNKPVNAKAALQRGNNAKPDDRLQGGRITTESNPVDATQRQQQNKEI